MTPRPRLRVIDAAGVAAATTAIVVPARDEAGRIGACLDALAAQDVARRPAVYLCVNNTSDTTAEIALDRARAQGLALVLVEVAIPSGGVGRARAIGHSLIARYGPRTSVVLSSDADCVAAPEWVRHMELGLARAPVVLGRIAVREAEHAEFPATFHERSCVEARYLSLSIAFEQLLDNRGPDGIGLNTAGGANLGMRAEVYRRIGGFAPLSNQEDRDLVDRAIRQGYAPTRARHAVVYASMRLEGRAPGGMAEGISACLAREEDVLDSALAPYEAMVARHLGPDRQRPRMIRADAERDMDALAQCVAQLRGIQSVEARRAFLRKLSRRHSVSDAA